MNEITLLNSENPFDTYSYSINIIAWLLTVRLLQQGRILSAILIPAGGKPQATRDEQPSMVVVISFHT